MSATLKMPPDIDLTLAVTLAGRGLTHAALDLAAQLTVADPSRAAAWAFIGGLERSAAILKRALVANPDHCGALVDLAGLERDIVARDLLVRALALAPDYIPALTNYGLWLQDRGRAIEASAPLAACVALAPGDPEFWSNLAAAFMTSGYPGMGAGAAARALAVNPSLPAAQYNLGMCRLMSGDFVGGLKGHEWRIAAGAVPDPKLPGKAWLGEPDRTKTLLIYAEQGLGDSLMFSRFVAIARQRVGRVMLVVQPQLTRLFANLGGADQVLSANSPLPPYDLTCSMMSLPFVLGLDLDGIPDPPNLTPDQAAFSEFRNRLRQLPGLKVGLVWQGNPAFPGDPTRSIALEALSPFAAVPGITWISLQKGADHARAGAGPPMIDWMPEISDLTQTAGLVANLDLVVGVDTMLGHLSGTLGRPVWIMNRFNTCWRWFLNRADSPWYPTVRLFRQPAPGAWAPVIQAVTRELSTLSAQAQLADR